jgi:hypothetical protein
MPFLDVTDVLRDPMFCEQLTITRREQAVSNKGRGSTNNTVVNPKPVGVVLPVTDKPLERGPDQQNLPKAIEIHTPFRLRSASDKADRTKTYQPDIVTWQGDDFTVVNVDSFSQYGQGWIRADAISTDTIDVEPA